MPTNKIEVYTDGAARGNPGPAGIGILIKSGNKILKEISEYVGETTNNIAEYMAFLRAIEETLLLKCNRAHFFSDSELLVKQINGEYRVKNEGLVPLYRHAKSLIVKFKSFSITHIPREKNKPADLLANKGINQSPLPFSNI